MVYFRSASSDIRGRKEEERKDPWWIISPPTTMSGGLIRYTFLSRHNVTSEAVETICCNCNVMSIHYSEMITVVSVVFPTLFSAAEYWRRRYGRRGYCQLSYAAVVRHDRSAAAASTLGEKRTSNTAGRCAIRDVSYWITAVEWRSSRRQRNISMCGREQRRNRLSRHRTPCSW